MKRAIVALVVAAAAIGAAAIWAWAGGKGSPDAKDASSCGPSARWTGTRTSAPARPSGKVLGHFDLAMAGCRFACATRLEYDAPSVIAQPGARAGKLTQCPVSGVVFNVDAKRPHVRVGAEVYVTCCDTCAEKLRRNPRRFVRA
jgi:TRASH domain-containing protein